MRIDVVSIFPDYLAALDLSLVGKARKSGLLDIRVHDLRDWTHDRHRTVDDTPYGGGAGMVMKPEPWGEALDAIAPPDGPAQPRLLVPSPAGRPFTQELAAELATEPWLVFACGRYEGIDARVAEYAAGRMSVDEVSIGDYVLNGGEVAVLVMVEAVARLLPGVIGNPGSLSEESHADGLLEYPVYTKPASWHGHDVPEVLLSGNHAAITAWRNEQSRRRTAERRPDLLARWAATAGDAAAARVRLVPAAERDAGELVTVLRAAFLTEAQAYGVSSTPPLEETSGELARRIRSGGVWKAVLGERIVGTVRTSADPDDPQVLLLERLAIAPDLQRRGIGQALLTAVERTAGPEVAGFRLTVGSIQDDNLRFYARAGYRETGRRPLMPGVELVVLSKRRRRH
ncbi:MAG: tRNA (guanosine(37)-N1)-methyltransferase TrmD [Kribbellaceae bacterium]